jgi:glycoprotein 3-alpha-L-fucosyltransferase
MESVAYYPGLAQDAAHSNGYDIVATYELDSDVPLPYFSWAEYPFARKPRPKRTDAMMAMLISNCGAPNGRLDYLRQLMDAGVTIHSYGACMHNRDMPRTATTDYGWQKLELVAEYKFVAAMENTNTKDYITEKLFGPLVVGSVPIHMGVPNVHDFAPPHSVISVHDFGSPAALASYLKYLDANQTAYDEYLAWKYLPHSPRFKALVDISKVHSFCRLCIKTADMNRREYGEEARPDHLPSFDQKVLADRTLRPLWVRERGKYWPMPVVIKEPTVTSLKAAILSVLRPGNPQGVLVWSIYDRYNRSSLITTDRNVRSLPRLTELEAIIVDPD